VIDAVSGAVVLAPFYFQDGFEAPLTVACHHLSDYKLTSELFIVEGELTAPGQVKGKVGRHFFHWKDGKFSPVYFDTKCEDYRTEAPG
jgi:hypothetical protein